MNSLKKEMRPDDKIAHTIEQAAHISACSRTSLFAAMKTGHLKARKNGRRTIILDSDLRTWLAQLPLRSVI